MENWFLTELFGKFLYMTMCQILMLSYASKIIILIVTSSIMIDSLSTG